MPIDPNIALGVKPMQFESPINQMAKMYELQNAQQSNQLNQMKMDEYQRGVANAQRRNALLGTFTPDMTVDQQVNALAKGGFLDEAKSLAESTAKVNADKRAGRTSELEAALKQHEVFGKALDTVITNPTKATAKAVVKHLNALHNEDPSDDYADLDALPDTPEAVRQWAIAHKGALDMLKTTTKYEGMGGYKQPITTDYFGNETFGKQIPLTQSPDSIASNQRMREEGELNRQNALDISAKPIYNAETGGFVTPPTATNPKGGFTPLTEVQVNKDINANRKALKTAGYDPETGLDEISGLIKKSTGSWPGAATDFVIGGMNMSTEGAKAIQTLKTKAAAITLDMLNGKLGAGISNPDRDFILEGLGDIANNTIPSETRLAAWESVKNRMISSGMFNNQQNTDKQNIIPKNEKMPLKNSKPGWSIVN